MVKAPLSDQDIQLVIDLFERVRPHQIYAAGDLSDPHGTHRVCLQVGVLELWAWVIVGLWGARDLACHAEHAKLSMLSTGAGSPFVPAAHPQTLLSGWEVLWEHHLGISP